MSDLQTVHSQIIQKFNSEVEIQCKAMNPRILFFIRLPKCASTSFVKLLRSLSIPLSFELYYNPSGAYDWDNNTIRREARRVWSKHRKIMYARHFYYVDFKHYGLKNFTYVTVIREPVARFVSSYLYYHFSSKRYIQSILKPAYKNESLISCIAQKHNGCVPNLLTKYFCGQHNFCKSGNSTALKRAKYNMKYNFAAVGLLEEIGLTMKLFRKFLPGYFYVEGEENQLPSSNKNEQSMVLSEEEEAAIRKANSADIKLYAYARELLQETTTTCNIS